MSEQRGVFDGVFGRGGAAAEVSGAAWLRAMLDVEAALVAVQAEAGMVPGDAAQAVAAACEDQLDLPAAAAAASATGTPVAGVVAQLRERVGESHAKFVHYGATSQDIQDSAAMLVTKRALTPIRADLTGIARRCAELADQHRDTMMAGRTLLQQAVPISFGLKAARWLSAADAAIAHLDGLVTTALAVQYGGAAGTLNAVDRRGPAVMDALATRLGLATPTLPWHSDRTRVARIGCGLGVAAGTCAKIATDIKLLTQTEVGEVTEAAADGAEMSGAQHGLVRGGSTAMPHKHNPVAAIAACACGQRTPGLVATLLGSMPGEHERAAGAWHAEWETLGDLLRLTGSAAAWLLESLTGLAVDPARMRDNLTEPLRDGSLGSAGSFIDRALSHHRGEP